MSQQEEDDYVHRQLHRFRGAIQKKHESQIVQSLRQEFRRKNPQYVPKRQNQQRPENNFKQPRRDSDENDIDQFIGKPKKKGRQGTRGDPQRREAQNADHYQPKQRSRKEDNQPQQQDKHQSDHRVPQQQGHRRQPPHDNDDQAQRSQTDSDLIPKGSLKDELKRRHYKQTRKSEKVSKHLQSTQPDFQDRKGTKNTKRKFGIKTQGQRDDQFEEDLERIHNPHSTDSDDTESFPSDEQQHQGHLQRPKVVYVQKGEIQDDQWQHDKRRQDYRRRAKESDGKPRDYDRRGPRQDNRKQGRNGKNQKSKFEPYYTEAELKAGISRYEVFEGIFIQNDRNRKQALIKCPLFDQRVQINSVETQNRALHGCLVAFKILRVLGKSLKAEEVDSDILDDDDVQIPKIDAIAPQAPQAPQAPEKEGQEEDWEDVDSEDEDEDEENERQKKQIAKDRQAKKEKAQKQQETENPLKKLEKLQKEKLEGAVVAIIKNPFLNRDIPGKLLLRSKQEERERKDQDDEKRRSNKNEKGRQQSEAETKQETRQIAQEDKDEKKDKPFQTINSLIGHIYKNYYISFRPVNQRIVWLNINKLEDHIFQSLDFSQDVTWAKFEEHVNNRYYAVQYSGWDDTSSYPSGKVLKEIGVAGNIEIESEVLLCENNVYSTDFSESCIKSLEPLQQACNEHGEYVIPPDERAKRKDLTKEYICSIDPVTARDLDDALSINEVEVGVYEVGVHIADVSHFVQSGTEVDKEAVLRTTSVYLVHKVLPMLPRLLCERLCSLNRDVERLAFSVFFQIDQNGRLLERPVRVEKTIIRSCAQLSYDVVNQLISGKIKSFKEAEERYWIANGFDQETLEKKVLLLNQIGQRRRAIRYDEGGSMSFSKHKMRFKLDEKFYPISFEEELRGEAQFMVEEWMLLANCFVGQKLIEFDRQSAVLRKHTAPKEEKVDYLRQLLGYCNLAELSQTLNVSTSKKMKETIDQIENDPQISPIIKDVLRFKLIRSMEAAQYFVVSDSKEEDWKHFALNFDVYTHFTSPIRRYPDIMVHRRLWKAIQNDLEKNEAEKKEAQISLQALMESCNECKLNSRRVSDGCDKIFLCLYLKDHPLETEGIIMSIGQKSLDLIVPALNIDKKMEYKDLKNITEVLVFDPSDYQGQSGEVAEKKDDSKKKKRETGKNGAARQEFVNPLSLCITYQDPKDPDGLRLTVLKALSAVKVVVTGTESFPVDIKIQIVIPCNNDAGHLLI